MFSDVYGLSSLWRLHRECPKEMSLQERRGGARHRKTRISPPKRNTSESKYLRRTQTKLVILPSSREMRCSCLMSCVPKLSRWAHVREKLKGNNLVTKVQNGSRSGIQELSRSLLHFSPRAFPLKSRCLSSREQNRNDKKR